MTNQYFIIDFDSTFIQVEALDELAKICLENDPEKKEKIKKIKEITRLGMEGKISFEKSLKSRIALLNITKKHIEKLVYLLKRKVTLSIKRNKDFFKQFKKNIYLVSGGFKEYILPVVKDYYLTEDNVLANQFIFNKDQVVGFDEKNPLTKTKGKVKIVKNLNLKGKIYVVGDGYSDLEIKKYGLAENFTALIENIKRENVVKEADKVIYSFDEFLYQNKLPLSLSYPKSKIKVLLLENIDKQAVKRFKKEGFLVESFPFSLPKEKLKEKIKDVRILGIKSKTKIDKEVLKSASHLLTIGCFSPKNHQIDLNQAMIRGIPVFFVLKNNEEKNIANLISEKIISYINTGSTFSSVNFPNILVDKVKKYHRFLHIHYNVVGVLAKINNILAKYHLNIENQILKTNSKIGYLVVEVNKKYSKEAIADLKKIPETIRFRVLY